MAERATAEIDATEPDYRLTPLQVAGILNVDRQTVYRYVKEGKLPADRPSGRGNGRVLLIPAQEVKALLLERISEGDEAAMRAERAREAEELRGWLLANDGTAPPPTHQ